MSDESFPQCDLSDKKCQPCHGGIPPMSPQQIQEMLKQVTGWEYTNGEIAKTYSFKNYYQTMAFVNAVAWIAHQEDHHPTLEISYKTCRVRYSTHAIKGISDNDFICAAKADDLIKE